MIDQFEDPDFVTLDFALENARAKLARNPDSDDAKSWLEVLERVNSARETLSSPKKK